MTTDGDSVYYYWDFNADGKMYSTSKATDSEDEVKLGNPSDWTLNGDVLNLVNGAGNATTYKISELNTNSLVISYNDYKPTDSINIANHVGALKSAKLILSK